MDSLYRFLSVVYCFLAFILFAINLSSITRSTIILDILASPLFLISFINSTYYTVKSWNYELKIPRKKREEILDETLNDLRKNHRFPLFWFTTILSLIEGTAIIGFFIFFSLFLIQNMDIESAIALIIFSLIIFYGGLKLYYTYVIIKSSK